MFNVLIFSFFFNDTATTEIYTLSLHDALPIFRGLKHLPVDITTIVTVADSGGSSGVLRKEFSCLPPGDFRNVIAALSEVEPLMEEMFQYRFQKIGRAHV